MRSGSGACEMTVIGTREEINDVLQGINPQYPKQNLDGIEWECCYSINGVNILLFLVRDEEGRNV